MYIQMAGYPLIQLNIILLKGSKKTQCNDNRAMF